MLIYKRIFTVLFCLILSGQIAGQSQPASEPGSVEIPPETREKAVRLLLSLSREAEQFYLPENRVKGRLLVARLLWEQDEKQARQLFQNAVSELDGMIRQILLMDAEQDEIYISIYGITKLRTDLLLEIAAHDPVFALSAFQTLSPGQPDGEALFGEDEALELQIASVIAKQDPEQTYLLAMKSIDAGLNLSVFDTLKDLHKKDPDVGAKLAREILKVILRGMDRAAAQPSGGSANTAANTGPASDDTSGINAWQIRQFLLTVIELNKNAVKEKKTPALTQAEYKELLETLAKQYLRQPYLSPYEVSSVIGEIEKYFPSMFQSIRAKFRENADVLNELTRNQEFQTEIEGKTTEEIIALIEKKPADQRDELYMTAAEKVYMEGKVLSAKELHERIRTRPEYDYLGAQIEVDLPLALARDGNADEIRNRLSGVKEQSGRIELLTTLAQSLLANGDRKSATELVREAATIFSGRVKSRQDLSSLLQLSYAFAALEPDQGFSYLENNMMTVNLVIAAGILIDEFNDNGAVKSDEVLLEVVEGESYRNLSSGVVMLRNLAMADFDRTVALADRFNRQEVRFFARFRIADALLDASAEESEKRNIELFQEEAYEH